MDGFKSSDNVCVFVDLPDFQGRVDIAQIYLKKVKLHEDRDFMAQKIAEITPGGDERWA